MASFGHGRYWYMRVFVCVFVDRTKWKIWEKVCGCPQAIPVVSKENIFRGFHVLSLLVSFFLFASSSSSVAFLIRRGASLQGCLEDGIENSYRASNAFVGCAALDKLIQRDLAVAIAVHFLRRKMKVRKNDETGEKQWNT